jgi:hypothetical protein
MAIIEDGMLSGGLGGLVFGKDGRVKTKGKVNQSEPTKKAASVFGKFISPLGKIIRDAFRSTHLGFTDGKMVNRMNSVLTPIIHQHLDFDGTFSFHAESFDRLRGFDFNSLSPLFNSLLFLPKVSIEGEELKIALPRFTLYKHLRFPRGSYACHMRIQVAFFNLETGKWDIRMEEVELDKSKDVYEAAEWFYSLPAGTVALVAIGLNFHQGKGTISGFNSKIFHPAGIVAAVYREGANVLSTAHWKNVKVIFPIKQQINKE